MESDLGMAMQTLVAVFHKYSAKEGDKYKLNKSELKTLLQNEFQMEKPHCPKKIDEIMKDLDENGDGEVDFTEFVIMVAALTVACNEFFEEMLKSETVKS